MLPLLEADIPDSPSGRKQPWLAMPIAEPLAGALEGRSLEDVVLSLLAIADTLTTLSRDHDVHHRDIKPSNLYELDGKALVGDFGLVDAPDLEELTRANRPLGPAHFTAYEMIADPVNAPAGPADVYSFGKTVWVMATNQRFPPLGHQPLGVRRFAIGDFQPHGKSEALDRLVEACTRIHPEERPTIDAVAEDLRHWIELAGQPATIDVSQIRTEFLAKRAPEMAARERAHRRKDAAIAAARRLQEAMRPLNDAIRSIDSEAEIDGTGDDWTRNVIASMQGEIRSHEIVWSFHRASVIRTSDHEFRYALRMGRTVELIEDGSVIFHTGIDVGRPALGGNDFLWMSGPLAAPVEPSLEVDRIIERLVIDTAAQLTLALEAYVENLPTADDY